MATQAPPSLIHDGSYLVTYVDGTDGIADITAPTVAELTAGIEMKCLITPDGLSREASDESVDVSRLCSTFSNMQVGRTSFDVSLTLVRVDENQLDSAGTALVDEPYHQLVKGKRGYLVIRDTKSGEEPYSGGDSTATPAIPGDDVEVYPVQVGTRSKATPAANEQMTYTVPFMVTSDPELNAVVTT